MSGKEEQRVRGHLAHLGASVLLIGRETELGAIHHRPLRPTDNFYDSTLLLIPCNWTHPLSLRVSLLAWEHACWGYWMKGRSADVEKTSPVFSFHPRQLWDWRSSFEGKTVLCAHNALWKAEKSHNNIVSIPQQNAIGKVALQSIANKPSGQQAVLCLRMTSIKRILKLGRWGSLMSRAGIEDMEEQKGERSWGIAESGSGGKPETLPQKSNYSSSREGVGTGPQTQFWKSQILTRETHTHNAK